MIEIERPRVCRGLLCGRCRDLERGRNWRKSVRCQFHVPGDKVDFACPLGKPWGFVPEEEGAGRSRGLGDTVAKITRAVGIKPCGGCKRRQAWLNAKVPYRWR